MRSKNTTAQVETKVRNGLSSGRNGLPLVEKTSFTVVFWPLYAVIFTPSISNSSIRLILNAAVHSLHKNTLHAAVIQCFFNLKKHTICCGSGRTAAHS